MSLIKEGVSFEDPALECIIGETEGFPYFLQEWGFHAWDVAENSPITLADIETARVHALAQLDADSFKVHFDRLAGREKDYMRAMAELGRGPHRSGEVANRLGFSASQAGPLRNHLIKKGMIFSGQYGMTAFTVPMFDAFMRRSMPTWRPPKRRVRNARHSPRARGGRKRRS